MSDIVIKINRSACISCGTCVLIAPKTFELDKKLVSHVLPPPNDPEKTILEAANSCATESIIVLFKK